eukprot:scaffold2403_cov87-Cylindrotheca_fusiformis.AAC.3
MSHSNRPKTSYGGGRQRRRSHPSSSSPAAAAATTTTTNFENDKEYQLDSPLPSLSLSKNKNNKKKKKHRDVATSHTSKNHHSNYSRLSFISANETSTVLTEPAIKPTFAGTRRSTRKKATTTTSPLEQANQLQGTTTSSSPDFEAIFLSQGLETTTTPPNKTKRGGGGGGGFVAKVKSVYSSIRNSISSPSPSSTTTATNRKRARSMQQKSKQQQPQQHRPMNQQDSLGTVTTPPSSSKKRKTRNGNTNNNSAKKKKKIVVDLVDDDADTDEDDNNKKIKPKSSSSNTTTTTVATHAQQDNNKKQNKKTTVYDTIATITESNKSSFSSAAAVQQSPSSCSPRRHQQQQQQQHETIKRTTVPASSRLYHHHQEQQLPTEHKLIMNNSSSSSSSFEEDNPKRNSSSDQQQQQRKEAFQAKVLEKNAKKYNNGDGPPVPTNFSTAAIPISTSTTAGNHHHQKDDSSCSDDDDESTSLLPEMCNSSGNNETARRTKTTTILQRAQVAAKTRPNPDMDTMLQQQYNNNTKKKKKSRKEEEEESDDDDDEVIDCTPEQEEEVITILDNSGCSNNMTMTTKPDGLQQRIPRKSTLSSSSTNLPKDLQAPPEINSGGLLQQFDHERNEWNVSNNNTDDVDWTKRPDNRTPPPSDDDDDENMFGIKRKTSKESSSPAAMVDDSFQLREMAERSANAKCFSHTLNRIHNKLKKNNNNKERRNEKQPAGAGAGAGFKLGKHNNTVKRRGNGVRVVPGRSTLASERQESFERKDGDAAVATSRHFSNKKSPQSETLNWGMSSNDPARTSTRQSDRIKQAQRRESLVDTDDSDQDNDEVLRQQEALIRMSRRRMMTRSSSKKPRNVSRPDDPIVLSSDSEEEEEKTNTKLEYELLRISIGKKVFNNGCHLTFQSNPRTNLYQLKLCFYKSTRTTSGSLNSASKREELNVKLTQDTLKLFKVYNAHSSSSSSRRNLEDDEVDFSFLVLQILPCPETNDLCKFTSAYRPRGDGPKKVQYIVLQFRAEEDHADCCIKVGEALAPIIGEPGVVQRREKELYAEALIEHSYKILNSRHKAQSTFTAGRDGESILFVYPFAEDPAQIDAAADGLREASGRRLTGSDADSSSSDDDEVQEVEPFACKVSSEPDAKKAEAKTKVRQTFVTIRVKDYERLYPEEWLNDSLVDFWMQWISRNEDKSSTKLHFFTSHFYTTLLNDGPNSVTSWTAKKNINIFDKKFIFIPINKDLHWSLCVVVNPGFIKNSRESDLEKQSNLDLPCLIFMDSLNLHKKATVRRKVEAWLNSEYSRIHPDEEVRVQPAAIRATNLHPAITQYHLLLPPCSVPKQNNTWDCGVFVCRYAYAVFHLRNRSFTYGALGGRSPFSRLITGGSEFDFDMNDIVRFRDEFRKLVENLSKVYSNWKRKEQANQKTCPEDETTYNSPTEEQTGEEGSEKENIVIARDDSSLSRLQDAVTEKVADDAKSEDLSTADHARSMDEQSSSDSSTTSSKASTRRGKIAKSTNTTDEDAESYPIYAGLAVDI